MSEIDASKIFLEDAKKHFPVKKPLNIFSLMKLDHYENPITDLLAFFLYDKNDHGLGNVFFEGFLDCIPNGDILGGELICKPQREVSTEDGKRIDLILSGADFSIIVENKIRHSAVNPFKSYVEYAEKHLMEDGGKIIYVLLSPGGKSEKKNWIGVSYPKLVSAIRKRLLTVSSKEDNKWYMFSKEFLNHLASLTEKYEMQDKNKDFIFSNLTNIKELEKIKKSVYNIYESEISEKIFPFLQGFKKKVSCKTPWPNGPRWEIESWNGAAKVVLYYKSIGNNITPQIRFYVYKININKYKKEDGQILLEKHFSDWFNETNMDSKRNKFEVDWTSDVFDEDMVFSKLISGIEKMNTFYKDFIE